MSKPVALTALVVFVVLAVVLTFAVLAWQVQAPKANDRLSSRSIMGFRALVLRLAFAVANAAAKDASGFGLAQHAVIFGLDGLDVRCLHQALDNGLAPHMHYLRSHGVYTDNARNNRPAVSLPNWATIFYGASVMFHGVTSNAWSYCAPSNLSVGIPSILPPCVVYPDLFS
ncbi:hypothetical protein SPRG_18008, partial [Saprolegnia parasitica CBS 223.65]